ncbi:MAG: pyridoxal-phosphate dependent enzyme [Actinobacteria bacterium]|jgi:threonine dehydratase|nr:pyridoxal-phosphate dependent enzyme [Actinomycetota bacterium]MBU1865935.1 pyridoxal-phosphate dependent enzyme [Actinomycetota bacterium]
MSDHPALPDVLAARERIGDRVVHTRLLASTAVPATLKLECEQVTGSFKLRGATNRLLAMSPAERARGVVAVSSGNHGRAVARVAADLGIDAVICLSSRVPAIKVDAIRSLGAAVVVAGPGQDEADAEARRLVAEEGLTLVHPFDDPMVIAGQGTVGLEIMEDRPDTDTIVVPMSGGGLIGGIAAAVKGITPGVRVIGVSQDLGPAMYLSIRAGRLIDVVEEDTLADALAGGLGPENRHSLEMCRDLVDESVLVTEGEIARAMAALYRGDGLRVEGGGAVGVAAILAGTIEPTPGMVVVVSGGNIGDEAFRAVVGR